MAPDRAISNIRKELLRGRNLSRLDVLNVCWYYSKKEDLTLSAPEKLCTAIVLEREGPPLARRRACYEEVAKIFAWKTTPKPEVPRTIVEIIRKLHPCTSKRAPNRLRQTNLVVVNGTLVLPATKHGDVVRAAVFEPSVSIHGGHLDSTVSSSEC